MLLSESWLRDWVQPEIGTEELAEKLTLAGLEVEGIEAVCSLDLRRQNSSKLVTGHILSTQPHPNADRLKLCQVDIGKRKPIGIVCGAANAREGLVVAVAKVGAILPSITIRESEIRGVTSEGMLCSTAELGLTEQADGLMELDSQAKPGTRLADYLQLNDKVIDVDLTPNRGDCLSVQGIAREISALTAVPMKDTAVQPFKSPLKDKLAIDMKAPDACPRFAGRIIRDIDMQAPTPVWMVERLRRSGVRSINLIVDITNYVMLETGQPMHAYDLDKLTGGIVVRMAKKRETIKLLDGSKVSLKSNNLVIADKKQAVGLAGIMGGDATAISDSTTNIFFEAAFFTPAHIIGKARQFGMHTDASHRFERGVCPLGQVPAIERATALLIENGSGKAGKICHAVDRKSLPKNKPVVLDKNELPRILGIKIPATNVNAILKRLGMKVDRVAKGWKVVAPAWRFDISASHDLVEEVGRCYGYDKIAPRMPGAESRMGGHPETGITASAIKKSLTAAGFYEAISYSFVDPDQQRSLLETAPGILLENPIADNMAEMRQSLWPGLLNALSRNLNRQEPIVRLFELGNVFDLVGKKRVETPKIAALACGPVNPRQWGLKERAVDFFDLKGDLENTLSLANGATIEFAANEHPALHPGQSATVIVNGKEVGFIGKLHPVKQKMLDIEQDVYLFEIDQSVVSAAKLPAFTAISRYPAVQRDLAVVVDRDVTASRILDLVEKSGGEYLKKLELFDIYTGERIENNKKSFAFSLTFQSDSSNLKSSEIESVTERIIAALRDNAGAELRN